MTAEPTPIIQAHRASEALVERYRAAGSAPDRAVVFESTSARSLVDWSPTLLKAARAAASSGNLTQAADFCETAMADDRVLAALGTRTNGLVALPISFEPARGMKRLVKALEAGEDWWASYPATALAELLRWGIMLGVGLAQQVWTDRGLTINRLIPVLKVWNPRYLRRDIANRKWLLKIEGDKEIEIQTGDIDGKWIIFMPYGDNRPWDRGAWRAISAWTLLKRYAIEDWARFSERHGQGTNVVVGPENGTKEKRKELADALRALNGDGTIVLPAGWDYKLVEAVANTWETFKAQKDAADMGVAVTLLGQNLSTEVSGPVSTGATLHGRVMQMYIVNDAESLTTCIHDQSLVWWSEFNFGARDAAPWPVYDTRPPEDRAANALVSKTRSETAKNIASLGIATVNEVRVAAGLEPLEKGGDELVKVVSAPAASTDPAADGSAKSHRPILPATGPVATGRQSRLDDAMRVLEFNLNSTRAAIELRGPEETEAASEEVASLWSSLGAIQGHSATIRVSLRAGEDCDSDIEIVVDDVDVHIVRVRCYAPKHVTALIEDARRIRRILGARLILRSGRSVPVTSGFVQGQLYTDAVVDHARERASKILDEDVVAVLEAVDASTSYEDVRKRLVKTFKGMSPTKLAKLTEAALTMVELGGRHAVNEDTDG